MKVLAVAVAVAVVTALYCFKHKHQFHGKAKMYQHGAVATDTVRCSKIGKNTQLVFKWNVYIFYLEGENVKSNM